MKPKDKRTIAEQQHLVDLLMSEVAFFQKFRVNDVREISEALKYLEMKDGENVVNYGDIGDKWYCLLSGNV